MTRWLRCMALCPSIKAEDDRRRANNPSWTVALLSEYVKEKLKVRVCNDTLRRTLHELGFRWRRPRWAVEREDPQAAALMAAITQAVWKADAQTMTWVEDETKFRALPPLRNMWMGAVF
jgi:hypothetical protein